MGRYPAEPIGDSFDSVLSEEHAQLGRMFLRVAHDVELYLQKADDLPPRPRIRERLACQLVCKGGKHGVALLACSHEIGVELLLRIRWLG
jgi:hypothetical protein